MKGRGSSLRYANRKTEWVHPPHGTPNRSSPLEVASEQASGSGVPGRVPRDAGDPPLLRRADLNRGRGHMAGQGSPSAVSTPRSLGLNPALSRFSS